MNKELLDEVIEDLKLKDVVDDEENFEDEDFEEEDFEEEDFEEEDFEEEDPVDEDDEEDDFDDEEVDDDYGDNFIEVDNYDFTKKLTPEQKASRAFARLRIENREKEEELKRLENIAEAYGFKSYNEMVEQLEIEAVDKRAKEENLDPKVYRRIHETERKLEALEKEREEEILRNKVNTVNARLDGFISSNNLTEDHKVKLLEHLDNDGFTIDDLYKIKNPNRLFTGYMTDDIVESKRQKALAKEKKKAKLAEDKFKGTGGSENFTMDDLINAVVSRRKDEY